jgi:hypothetical protein
MAGWLKYYCQRTSSESPGSCPSRAVPGYQSEMDEERGALSSMHSRSVQVSNGGMKFRVNS